MKTIILLFFIFLNLNAYTQRFILDGPDAPDAFVSSNGQNFVFDLYNEPSSNNYSEMYVEYNPNIPGPIPDSAFRFQGYLIFQIDTSLFDQEYINSNYILDAVLTNPTVARIQGQSDITDTNSIFINHDFDSVTMQCYSYNIIPSAANSGIEHHYEFSTDAFTGNPFTPGNTYCFIALSYAVHNSNHDQGCYPLTKPVAVSKKGVQGGLSRYCLDLATMEVDQDEIQVSKIYVNQNIILETSLTEAEFTLFTMDGKMVLSKEINQNLTIIDIQNLSTGIYFYRLKSGNDCKTNKIFISIN